MKLNNSYKALNKLPGIELVLKNIIIIIIIIIIIMMMMMEEY